jgi:ribosomal-protein-serine acetyltransferase
MNVIDGLATVSFAEAPLVLPIGRELELRKVTVKDEAIVSRLMQDNLQHLGPTLDWDIRGDTSSGALVEFKASHDERAIDYRMVHLGQFVGLVSLHSRRNDVARMGCWIAAQEQGKGIATRSACALRDAAFDLFGLRALVLDIRMQNHRSFQVAKRLGASPTVLGLPGVETWLITREDRDAQNT